MLDALLHRVGLGRRVELLGRILVRSRVITEQQLRTALAVQRRTGRHLGRIVVERRYATEFDVLQAIARHYRISPTSLTDDFGPLLRRPVSLRRRIATMRIPIRVRLSVAVTFMVAFTVLTLSAVILARQRERLYAQTVRIGAVSLSYIANDAAVPLLEDDTLRLNSLVKDSASVEEITFASIVDLGGVVRAHTDTSRVGKPAPDPAAAVPPAAAGRTRELSRPILFSGKTLGTAHVGVRLDLIDEQMREESLTIIALSLVVVLVGILVAVFIDVGFSRPIAQLVVATQEIGKGNFRHRIERVSGDEFGDLAAAFNFMSRELWKKHLVQESFGSYVSPEVLEMILAHPEGTWLRGERREVTVLFADVRGFTPFVEANEPERVVEAVNEYFGVASRHVLAHGGYVDKFIGDGVVAVFGVPVAQADHARRAVRAAVAIRRELLERAAGDNPILGQVGIGIDSGVAVAGDLGSELKRQYSVMGDCVNVAARLNAFAPGGKIIVSRSTREAAGETLAVTPLPPVTVKGKSEPIEIFEVTGLAGEDGSSPAAPGP